MAIKRETTGSAWSGSLLFLAPAALVFPPAFALAGIAVEYDENYKWAQHRLAAVLLFGAFASTLLFGPWKNGKFTFALSLIGLGFAAVMLTAGLPDFDWSFAAAGLFVAVAWHLAESASVDRPLKDSLIEGGALWLSATLSFWAGSRLSWWRSFQIASPSWENKLLFLAIGALMIYATSAIIRAGNKTPTSRKRVRYLFDACALFLLAGCVIRTGSLNGNPNFAHHWGVFVEPAELVREGHALLGEVPSQYGFFSILLLAVIPADDRFTAVYAVNCTLLWFSGAVIYFCLRTLLFQWWWPVISALLAVCAVGLICGNAPELSGPMLFPSMGGMRFVWVYALVGFLVWRNLKPTPDGSLRCLLGIGTALWLLGVLWSVESGVYVTALWFPAASILASPNVTEVGPGPGRFRQLLGGIFRVVAMAIVFLGIALIGIELFYRFSLQRAPQWPVYWEYAVAFTNGFVPLPMNPVGGVWELLLLHAALLGSLVSLDFNRRRSSIALIWAAWGVLWSVSTYYITISHGNNITNLAPLLLLVTGILGHAWRGEVEKNPGRLWVWITMPAFFTMILWLVVSQPEALKRQIAQYSIEPHPAKLRQPVPEALVDLIKQCRLDNPDPYSVIAPRIHDTVSVDHSLQNPAWMPIDFLPLFDPLPIQRRFDYLDIYTDHGQKSGWLLSMIPPHGSILWIFEYANARYTTDLVLTNSNWIARHYVPREKKSPHK